MVKVITNFSYLTDDALAVQATTIVTDMTDNINFATPAPPLADVQAALTAYDTALAAAKGGGLQQTAEKNQCRHTLESVLSQLAAYVQANCNHNEAIALSSGFPLAKTPQPAGPLPKPENLKARLDKPGAVALTVRPVPHAMSYLWKYKPAAGADWQEILTTSARTAIQGLTSGQQYSFMVTAIGAHPSQTWSDEVKSFVL